EMSLSDDIDIEDLAEKLEGYVGSDIESLCREAAMLALRKDPEAEEVEIKHFEDAMEETKPTATEENREHYEQMMQKMDKVEKTEDSPDYYA
ncbi:MAG: AAA family ATPase, partial [Nanohaloarchaea archaeon SW_10_44_10]